jgi:hypothetical protein
VHVDPDYQAPHIGCDRQLHLDVGVDLDVAGVAVGRRRAGIAARTDQVQRAAVHVDVYQRRPVARFVQGLTRLA